MKLNKRNLKKINFKRIAVFENGKLIDVITKIKNDFYVAEGMSGDFEPEDIIIWFSKRNIYIYDADLFCEPKEN